MVSAFQIISFNPFEIKNICFLIKEAGDDLTVQIDVVVVAAVVGVIGVNGELFYRGIN